MSNSKSTLKKKTRLTSLEKHVGRRLHLRRMLLNVKQKDIAESIGVTFQQIQKYENGTNRISSGTLFLLSKALRTSVDFFFDGYEGKEASVRPLTGFSESPQEMLDYGGLSRSKQNEEIISLFSDFYKSTVESVRCAIRRFIEEDITR